MGTSDHSPDDTAFVERRAPRPSRAFPGGQARLPRLQRPAGAPDEVLDEAADDDEEADKPLRRNPDERSPAKDRGFEAYYSAESLFEQPSPGSADADAEDVVAQGPYGVLGLRRSASWEDISRAHRKLVSKLHPDRYVGAEDDVREAAERRVRDVNEAYATIRRERSVHRV